VAFLRIPDASIDIVTEAAGPAFRAIDAGARMHVRSQHEIPADATLLVHLGGMNRHKNLIGLLEAVRLIVAARPDVWLAIIGDTSGKGFSDNVPELLDFVKAHPPLDRHVRFTGYLPDQQAAELLNEAAALVFPSFWEGFGLPAVEAMSCGVPVLASSRGSLPEIVGQAGLFFDPASPTAIAECVLRFLGDSQLREGLGQEALKRSKLFSWDRAAALAEASFQRCYEDWRGRVAAE
jgi:glycosyltransferase involved in cell wall biosynthesis